MVESIMRVVGTSVSVLDTEETRRLKTSVDFGAKDVSLEDTSRIVTERGAAELNGKLRACFASTIDIATDVVTEKLIDRLETLESDLVALVQARRATVNHHNRFCVLKL